MLGCRDKPGAEPRLHPRTVPLRSPWDCLGTPRGTPGPFWGCNLRPLGRKPGPGKAHRGTSPGLSGVRRACRGGCSAALPGPPGPGHEEAGGDGCRLPFQRAAARSLHFLAGCRRCRPRPRPRRLRARRPRMQPRGSPAAHAQPRGRLPA